MTVTPQTFTAPKGKNRLTGFSIWVRLDSTVTFRAYLYAYDARHGHPVAKLLPVRPRSCVDLIGSIPELRYKDEDVFSTGERWDAES